MQKNYILKISFTLLFTCVIVGISQAQWFYNRGKVSVYAGAAFPLGSFASDESSLSSKINGGASTGVSGGLRYTYYFDAVITPKDAIGIWGEYTFMWNPLKKGLREEYKLLKEKVPQYFSHLISVGPNYTYYFGKDEKFAAFADLGVTLSFTSMSNTDQFGLGFGIGAMAGIGFYYSEWASIGIYYNFLGKQMIVKDFELYQTPHLLQLRVAFHF